MDVAVFDVEPAQECQRGIRDSKSLIVDAEVILAGITDGVQAMEVWNFAAGVEFLKEFGLHHFDWTQLTPGEVASPDCLGQSVCDNKTRERLEQVVSEPPIELIHQTADNGRVDGRIRFGSLPPAASHFRLKNVEQVSLL
jgi:hypothetical protein